MKKLLQHENNCLKIKIKCLKDKVRKTTEKRQNDSYVTRQNRTLYEDDGSSKLFPDHAEQLLPL